MALEQQIDKFIREADDEKDKGKTSGVKSEPQEPEPQYRMISDEKIPISKKHGAVWESRKKAAWAKLETNEDLKRWETAISYFQADQISKAKTREGEEEDTGTNLRTKNVESENLVFANATALVPAIYAKNPKVEVNIRRADMKGFEQVCERLINVLLSKRTTPGIGLKRKGRKAVLLGVLTNYAYIEVGYTRKQDASETSLVELQKLSKELAETKDKKKIREVEGKLMALEDKVDLLRPSGPWARLLRGDQVLFDPDANDKDDARWCMIADYLDTEFLKAVYGTANEDGKYASLYEPSHILKVGSDDSGGVSDEIANFSIFDTSGNKTFKDYGFSDDESFKKAQRTKVWYVWDKATRRIYLYSDKDWKWPLWVWDDFMQYDDFFPVVQLEFYTDPVDMYARSEVTYYIHQQDAINTINNEIAKVRDYIVGKVIYNKSMFGDQMNDADKMVEAFIEGTGPTKSRVLGVRLPPETDLTKMFAPFVPQSAHMLNTTVFDKDKSIQAIDRVSSVNNVMRGVEFKTNTTNKAIDSYESSQQTRLDEKIDQVEDFIGEIAWKLLQCCLRFMEPDEVALILGDEFAEPWAQAKEAFPQMLPFLDVSVVGGSSLKANSTQKKQQAAQLGQVLGQFASAAPAAIIVALKLFQEAYDEVIITAQDWQMIMDSVNAAMQKGNTSPDTQSGDAQSNEGNPDARAQQQAAGDAALQQVEQIVDSFPPEAKQELAKLIEADVPIRAAIAEIVQLVQASQQQAQ